MLRMCPNWAGGERFWRGRAGSAVSAQSDGSRDKVPSRGDRPGHEMEPMIMENVMCVSDWRKDPGEETSTCVFEK